MARECGDFVFGGTCSLHSISLVFLNFGHLGDLNTPEEWSIPEEWRKAESFGRDKLHGR